MATLPYTKKQFIQRIKRHLANGFPKSSFAISDNEVLLAIDAAIPMVLKTSMFENAKFTVTNVLDIPSAYLVTYNYTVTTKNSTTGEWYVTLDQPVLAIPDGYNITNVYFADTAHGISQSVYIIKTKRAAYRNLMPKPTGIFARIVGQTMFLKATNGIDLYQENLFVEMPISRTSDIDAAMSIPDDAIQPIFELVIKELLQRYTIPQDIIKDNLPAGSKNS